MEQQKTSLQALICSLNACELQSLILQLSKNDALLSDRIVGIIRHLFPDIRIPNGSLNLQITVLTTLLPSY